ncbi:hypothetical protein FSP39_023532 [Pinctada imbricata]|uniref:Secernin-3 n=1 Tax=Pinctada imbricata TaxID=66713 RepID=A0AA88YNC6_PINIB|nr:hypothetical protein FSP39_023532 [Pinctada imbricata]
MADSFVVLPPLTANGCVVFGTNSHRPACEVQEVVLVKGSDHNVEEEKCKCTYIEIDQVARTYTTILSKPGWAWGAEMGANEKGVCAVNHPVWNKLIGKEDLKEKLIGQDIVRLVLERCATARESVDLIGQLLITHGQGGPCSEESKDWAYHNSFLVVDSKEAWVVETAGKLWVAKVVKEGVRNLSNQLTIEAEYDLSSPDIVEQAKSLDLYKEEDGPFNFSRVFSERHCEDDANSEARFNKGKELLEKYSSAGNFKVKEMMEVLRSEEINTYISGSFVTTGSQVSVLSPRPGISCHWFTATPKPQASIFKPFIFCPNADIGHHTKSPVTGVVKPVNKEGATSNPILVDRKHPLWLSHEKFQEKLNTMDPIGEMVLENIKELESKCMEDMEEMMSNFDESGALKAAEIFMHIASIEINFYK